MLSLSFEQCFYFISTSFPLRLAFDVGGLCFEFCAFLLLEAVALRSASARGLSLFLFI